MTAVADGGQVEPARAVEPRPPGTAERAEGSPVAEIAVDLNGLRAASGEVRAAAALLT